MNANLAGMKRYYSKKRIPYGLITADDGTPLTSEEAHALIEWGLKNGYRDLNSMPDFKDIKELQPVTKCPTLQERLDIVLMEYVRAFEDKHGVEFEFAINDDLMTVLHFGDWYFDISDIVYDIDNNLSKHLILNWHNNMMDETGNPDRKWINLHSYAQGLRLESLYR